MSTTLLPGSPSLSWQNSFNNVYAASGTLLTDQRAVLRAMKNIMLGFGTLPLQCKGSSDSTTAAMDNTDRWSADNKLVWANAGTAHSWIVLQMQGSSVQLCFDCNTNNAGAYIATVAVSVTAGFTGGSTTARPTATDEAVLVQATSSNNWFFGNNNPTATQNFVYDVQLSTDGNCLRAWCFYNSNTLLFIRLDKLSPVETGVTNPFDNVWLSSANLTSDCVSYANLVKTNGGGQGSGGGKAKPVSTVINTRLSTMGGGSAMKTDGEWAVAASPYSGDWFISDCECFDATNNAPLGKVQDFYIGSASRNSADNYPAGGGKVWGTVGNAIMPTGGTLLQKT